MGFALGGSIQKAKICSPFKTDGKNMQVYPLTLKEDVKATEQQKHKVASAQRKDSD